MQRAAASAPSPPTDTTSEPTTKRQKTSHSSSRADSGADLRAMQAAVAAEDLKRTQALDRQAAEAGDTKWTLQGVTPAHGYGEGLNVVNAAYGLIDARPVIGEGKGEEVEDAGVRRPQLLGRKSFGSFGQKSETAKQKKTQDDNTDSSSDDASNSDDEAGEPRGTNSEATDQLRAKRKARKEADKAEALQLSERRRNKAVKLNKVTSISSGGAAQSRGSPQSRDMTCFACGAKGHGKKDCPNAGGARGKRRSA